MPSGASGIELEACEAGTIAHLEGPLEGEALAAILAQLGLGSLPPAGKSGGSAGRRLLSIGPAIWLLVESAAAPPAPDLRGLLARAFEVALDASHGWLRLRVGGRRCRELLAKGCALDLHPREFPPGACAATAFARMRTIVWRSPEASGFELFVGRSYGASLMHWLVEAAEEYGLEPQRELRNAATPGA